MTIQPEQLHVIRCYDRLPPMPGGMERHIAELTAAQRRQGVRVTEIHNSGEAAGESIRLWHGRRLDKVRPAPLRWALFYVAATMSQIDFADGRVRALHVHGDWPAFLLARLLQHRIRPQVAAASLHATRHASLKTYARALKGFDPIFVTGLEQCRDIGSALGRPLIHLPSAPADRFFSDRQSAPPTVDVIAVGSLVAVKQLDTLLACAALRPKLVFAIIGDGPERRSLERAKDDLGLKMSSFAELSRPIRCQT